MVFLDILGFKSIMDNINNTDELGDQMSHILQTSILSAMKGDSVYVENNPSLDVSDIIKVYQFSDSIIIYTEDDDSETLYKLIKILNLLLAQSLIRGFPLRGALTSGDLFVNGSIIVGEPLVRAYQIESRQEWSGLIVDCPIDSTIATQLINEKLVTNHMVTLKGAKDSLELISEAKLVINWPQYCGLKVGSTDKLEDSMTKFSGKPKRQKDIDKINRTVAFFIGNIGSKELPSFNFGVGRVVFNESGEALFMKK